MMILPLGLSMYYDESLHVRSAILQAMLITVIFGRLVSFRRPKNIRIRVRESIAITGLTWTLMVFFGALPFYLSGGIPSLVDAIFESASGFTTTGSSILTDVEALPHSLLFWRSFSHFIGGMGVLVFSIALLPHAKSENVQLMKTEMPGPSFE